MLSVKPVFEIEKIKAILNRHNIESKTAVILEAREKDDSLGYVVIKEEENEIKMLAFEIVGCKNYESPTQNDNEIAEYLIRSAGSYALNRNKMILSTKLTDRSKIWNKFRFVEINNKYQTTLDVLFKKCKNCSE